MTKWLKKSNTAVITGGASGIGLAAAEQYLQAGMNVVLADFDAQAFAQAERRLAEVDSTGEVMTVACDVTDMSDLESLRDQAYDRFGAVHCLMNNAGIAQPIGTPWEDLETALKLLQTNLMGVIQGCHTFIPKMLEQGDDCAVINTGSKQGITRPPGNYAYNLSKVGVLSYTESVAHALRNTDNCRISAHLLVPGFVYSPMIERFIPEKPAFAWTCEQTVQFMLERLADDDFYIICPDGESPRELDEKRMRWTADDIIDNRPALSRWHPDFTDAYKKFVDED